MFTTDNPDFKNFIFTLQKYKSNKPRALFAGVFVVIFLGYVTIAASAGPESNPPDYKIAMLILGVSYFLGKYLVIKLFGYPKE
jgi:hypothetical protein